MKLFLVLSDDGDSDAIVQHVTKDEALAAWRYFFAHRIDTDEQKTITITEIPTDSAIVGVVPWDTLLSDEVEI